jgi:AAA15 family ATPase/GTPase
MHENMISSVEIKNFKIFDYLEIHNFKRVNLIGGKNNIGKTALLEAIELNVSAVDFNALLSNVKRILQRRHNFIEIDIFRQSSNSLEVASSINNISLEYNNRPPEPILTMGIGEEKQGLPISRVVNSRSMSINSYGPNKVNYISSSYVDSAYLSELYGFLTSLGKDEFIDSSLRLFDERILAVRQVIQGQTPVFRVKISGLNTPVLLSSLGEGINRFMAMICAIWASQDGYLFIDEIENGIHYTNYEKLWRMIFEVASEANCQLFVTTHSRECIEAFNDANRNGEGGYFELYKNKSGKIVSKYRDFDQLSYSLTHGGRFRGE